MFDCCFCSVVDFSVMICLIDIKIYYEKRNYVFDSRNVLGDLVSWWFGIWNDIGCWVLLIVKFSRNGIYVGSCRVVEFVIISIAISRSRAMRILNICLTVSHKIWAMRYFLIFYLNSFCCLIFHSFFNIVICTFLSIVN